MLELEHVATERRRSSRPHSTRPKLGTNGAGRAGPTMVPKSRPDSGTAGGVTPERVDLDLRCVAFREICTAPRPAARDHPGRSVTRASRRTAPDLSSGAVALVRSAIVGTIASKELRSCAAARLRHTGAAGGRTRETTLNSAARLPESRDGASVRCHRCRPRETNGLQPAGNPRPSLRGTAVRDDIAGG